MAVAPPLVAVDFTRLTRTDGTLVGSGKKITAAPSVGRLTKAADRGFFDLRPSVDSVTDSAGSGYLLLDATDQNDETWGWKISVEGEAGSRLVSVPAAGQAGRTKTVGATSYPAAYLTALASFTGPAASAGSGGLGASDVNMLIDAKIAALRDPLQNADPFLQYAMLDETDLPEFSDAAQTAAVANPDTMLNRTTRFATPTSGTTGITQTLPAATAGRRLAIGQDSGTTPLIVAGAGTDVIGAAANQTARLVAGELLVLHCTTAGRWRVGGGNKSLELLDGRYMPRGGLVVLVEDDFSRWSDGPISGKVPRTGDAWLGSGPVPPQVVGGRLYSTANGYAYQPNLPIIPVEMVAEGMFSGTDPTVSPLTTAIGQTDSSGAFVQVIHPIYSPRGFTLQLKEKDQPGFEFITLMTGLWDQPCAMDDTTPYRFHLAVRGATATVTGPNGETFSRTDPRIRRVHAVANLAYFQPTTVNSGAGVFKTRRALVLGMPNTSPLGLGEDVLDRGRNLNSDPYRRSAGSEGSYGQVKIGRSPTYDQPALMFGAETEVIGPIRTVLTAAAAIGATTLSTVEKIPAGSSIRLDGGAAAETVTASTAVPGGSTGAATRVLTAGTTIAHDAGTVVVAIPPATRRREMRYDPEGDFCYLPDATVVTVPNFLAVGAQNDVYFRRLAAQVMGLGAGSSFQADGTWNGGQFRMGNYRLWVDGTGLLRMKAGAPTSDTDGTVIGSQS